MHVIEYLVLVSALNVMYIDTICDVMCCVKGKYMRVSNYMCVIILIKK